MIKQIIKQQQPKEYAKLKTNRSHKRHRRSKNLSFDDYKNLMENEHVYKRIKGGSLKQIR